MMVTTYVFVEKEEKLSLNYPQYPLLSGTLLNFKMPFLGGWTFMSKK